MDKHHQRWEAAHRISSAYGIYGLVAALINSVPTLLAIYFSKSDDLTAWTWLVTFIIGTAIVTVALAYAGSMRSTAAGLTPQPQPQLATATPPYDPWLPAGKTTSAKVLFDLGNYRLDTLKKSNVFEVKGMFLDESKTGIQLVIIFDKWTLERGARIEADNRVDDKYRTSEDVFNERYAIYSIHGIKSPCVIDIKFQSPQADQDDEEGQRPDPTGQVRPVTPSDG